MTNSRLLISFGAAGAVAYYVSLFWYIPAVVPPQFGTLIYNYYWLSILEGQFDVPARIVGWEGHFTPDGKAFVYHGLAPLVTRAIAHPFVDLTTTSLTSVTIFVFSWSGTLAWQALLLKALRSRPKPDVKPSRDIAVVASLMVWVTGPGIFLTSNGSFYHEPISVAYFLTALFSLVVGHYVLGEEQPALPLVWIAVIAGLSVFARPHVAVGLYSCVCLLALHQLYRRRWAALVPVICTGAVLGALGGGLLIFNYTRFGDPFLMHGTFFPSSLEMGVTYLSLSDTIDTMKVFNESGRFNVARIPANGLIHFFLWPEFLEFGLLPINPISLQDPLRVLLAIHHDWLGPFGPVRMEGADPGVLLIWPLPMVLAGWGLVNIWKLDVRLVLVVAGMALITVFVLSYPTITLRYRLEIWPFLLVLSLTGFRDLAQLSAHRPRSVYYIFIAAILLPLVTIGPMIRNYQAKFAAHGTFGILTREVCETSFSKRPEFTEHDIARICALHESGT